MIHTINQKCLQSYTLAIVSLFGALTSEMNASVLYSLVPILQPGTTFSRATGINSSGQVSLTLGFSSGGTGSFVVNTIGGVSFAQISNGAANGINNSGQVVGAFPRQPAGGNGSIAFRADTNNLPLSLQDLGTFGGNYAIANGINNQGDVVGASSFATSPESFPFLWDEVEGIMSITPLPGVAYGVNSANEVVGWTCSNGDCSSTSAFFLRPNSALQLLGTFGGNASTAYAINDFGLVVGSSRTGQMYFSPAESGFVVRAFVANLNQSSQDTTPHSIGTLGGTNSEAYAVNNLGQVVGTSFTGELSPGLDPIRHAFLYSDGAIYDLNDLIVPEFQNQYGPLIEARGINQLGQIVANTSNGSFLLTPIQSSEIPEPASIGQLLGGLLVISKLRRYPSSKN